MIIIENIATGDVGNYINQLKKNVGSLKGCFIQLSITLLEYKTTLENSMKSLVQLLYDKKFIGDFGSTDRVINEFSIFNQGRTVDLNDEI